MISPQFYFSASAFHATKRRVHVGIMWLKPIAKRPPEHTCRCARRTALHDEMFAVKKIRGVSGIERKWLEAGKRREGCPRPFPSVPYKVGNTKITEALGVRP